MIFDDGSTLDVGTAGTPGAATQSPPGYLISDYGNNFDPGNLSPGATSMMDVLKYGFGRLVDYKTASLQSQNTPPQYAPQAIAPTPGFIGGGISPTVVLVGVAVLGGLALLMSRSR